MADALTLGGVPWMTAAVLLLLPLAAAATAPVAARERLSGLPLSPR
jgi:hypothetical protein